MKVTAESLKKLAKEHKVKNWWKMKAAELRVAILETTGWDKEPEKVQEFLLSGGEITREAPPSPEKKRVPRKLERSGKPKSSPKETKEGVTLAQICEELGVLGRIARRKLRGSDIPKPDGNWVWPEGSSDLEKVRKLLGKEGE